MAEWQRAQQYFVDDAEDRGVRADADRDRQDRQHGEARVPDERSQRIAQVLPQVVDH